MAVLALFAVRAAWLSDDAYITLRTVDNFWHGYGLRWNVLERVQTYTHPLWMMVLAAAYGVTREAYFTTLLVSGTCLAGTIALLRLSLPGWPSIAVLTLLASSRAFIGYSTSGLENPLSHLLLAAFMLEWLAPRGEAPRLSVLAWLAMLCALTRLDLALLVAPELLAAAWRTGPRRAWPALLLAGLPLAGWHLFTLAYYGSLVPNTAIAKLATGIPQSELIAQGGRYLQESLRADFVTLPLTAAGVAFAITYGRRAFAVAIGLIAYLAYIVWIGGDFMSGRFLTAPLVCASIALVQALRGSRALPLVTAAAIAAAIVSPRGPLTVLAAERAELVPEDMFHGIIEERTVYAYHTGLYRVMAHGAHPSTHPWAQVGRDVASIPRVIVSEGIGLLGYHAGPAVHIIDPLALADPFLARLPALRPWRSGHFRRDVPAGYVEGWRACVARVYPNGAFVPGQDGCATTGESIGVVTQQLADERLRPLLGDVLRVTQGPIVGEVRWQAIRRLAGQREGRAGRAP